MSEFGRFTLRTPKFPNTPEFRSPEASEKGITISLVKRRDEKLEISIAGPFSRSFLFVCAVPSSLGENGLVAVFEWGSGKITLSIDGVVIETKDRDAPVFQFTMPSFSSTTDEGVRCLELAIAFDKTSDQLVRALLEDKVGLRTIPLLITPLVVNESFSLELYLKALHFFDHRKRKRGHELTDLFQALGPSTQQDLKNAYAAYVIRKPPNLPAVPSFEHSLQVSSEAFESWRYIHEIETTAVPKMEFAGTGLRIALRDVCRVRHPAAFAFEAALALPPTSPAL